MEISFKGKRILVTGAGQGIGRGIAVELWRAGANIVALSRTRSHLESLQSEYPSIDIVDVDITDWDKTRQVVDSLGHFDALVNNAAVAVCEPFLTCTAADFDKTFNVNVKAALNISQVVAKKMVENKTHGTIVNISSQASKAALKDHAIYSASKAALDALTRAMALELGPHGIRVNAVNPTVTMTAMAKVGWSDPERSAEMKAKIPLGRFGEVFEVVNAVVFLLSEKSTMINGVELPIDGGFLATYAKIFQSDCLSQTFLGTVILKMKMDQYFKGKRILVTGGCQGIGKGTVLELWRLGADVVALSHQAENLAKLKSEYPLIETACVDLADWDATREVVDSLGVFHGLVNCAGIVVTESLLECTPTVIDQTMNVNVKAIINVTQILAKKMIDNCIKGSIVNISSQTSKAAIKDHVVYAASKGAVDSMTQVMALELGAHAIRVNAVNPTVVMTELGRRVWSEPSKSQYMLSKIPLGRFAEVQEIVNAIVFLLSDKASMINAVHLPVDGGFLCT
ncbi:uncharacterized short-chain type dehydrogenase/reductase y4vI-like [Pararge aegeria]|nr:uncharacterized short-chain type dehydrogenase/reductase y4vI-like [Pararge aegeria]